RRCAEADSGQRVQTGQRDWDTNSLRTRRTRPRRTVDLCRELRVTGLGAGSGRVSAIAASARRETGKTGERYDAPSVWGGSTHCQASAASSGRRVMQGGENERPAATE